MEKIETKIVFFNFIFEPNFRITIWLQWRRTLIHFIIIELLFKR